MISTVNSLIDTCFKKLSAIGAWVWRGAIDGFGGRRSLRYFWLGLAGVAVIWTLTAAYLTLTPRSYKSGFTFVLPGAGAGTTVNLEQIGQASSISQSPFSNQRVNPTESYKRLLLSDRVYNAARDFGGFDWMPRPNVKLLDQTQFMEISIGGPSPETVHDYAVAYEQAFLKEVDALRDEERRAREVGYKEMIAEFEDAVSTTRAALLNHQSASGLASLNQFNENVAQFDNLNTQLNEARIVEAELERRRNAMLDALGLSQNDAADALLLAADPAFVALANTHAEQEAYLAETVYKFGENHPRRIKAEREHHGLTDEIAARAHRFVRIHREKALQYARMLSSAEYSSLLKAALEGHSLYEAARARGDKIASTVEMERTRLKELSVAAAKLDDLARAHKVSEAVFRSAMARIDTNKTDLFASYPLIQTVEPPFTPDTPSSPMVGLGLVGAIAATVFYLMGLTLTCLRLSIVGALLKKT